MCLATLCIWDHTVGTARERLDLCLANGEALKLVANEAAVATLIRSRTLVQRVVVVLRRAAGLVFSIAVQGAAAYAIVSVSVCGVFTRFSGANFSCLAPPPPAIGQERALANGARACSSPLPQAACTR